LRLAVAVGVRYVLISGGEARQSMQRFSGSACRSSCQPVDEEPADVCGALLLHPVPAAVGDVVAGEAGKRGAVCLDRVGATCASMRYSATGVGTIESP
jgi:hypothetical protein